MIANVTITGYRASKSVLDKIGVSLTEGNEVFLQKLGDDIVAEAKNNLQNNQSISTGALLASLKVIEVDNNHLVVGSDLPYAGIIEFGRGPITPKQAMALTWIDKTTGKRVFSHYSKAVDPKPYLEPAVMTATKGIGGIYKEKMVNDLKSVSNTPEKV